MKIPILVVIFLLNVTLINANSHVYESKTIQACANKFKTSEENEIFSIKCETKILEYIVNILQIHNFKILSISCNEPHEPMWVINYCKIN